MGLERANKPRRVAGIDAGLGDVLGDHRTGPDDSLVADVHRQDGGIATDGDVVADGGGAPLAAIAAGRAADPDATAQRVVLVSRDFPLLEGGNGAVLLAGLSLAADVAASEPLPESSLAPYASVRWKPTSVYCEPAVVISVRDDVGFQVGGYVVLDHGGSSSLGQTLSLALDHRDVTQPDGPTVAVRPVAAAGANSWGA